MADESFDSTTPPTTTRPDAGRGRRALFGCGAVVFFGALAFTMGTWRASSSLDARVASLKEQVAALRARPQDRPVLFVPALDGNSVDHLRAAEWIVGPVDGRTPHPSMVTPALERGHPDAHSANLTKVLGEAIEALRRGEPLSAEAARETRTYASVIQHVRDGLRRGRCDWQPTFEDGIGVDDVQDGVAVRAIALLMACAAELELEGDPRVAARTGLEIVAFGDDVARQPGLIQTSMGVSVKGIGLDSLERTLRRAGLPRAGYEEIITGLAATGPTDIGRGVEAERLFMQADLARASGRPLVAAAAPDDGALMVRWLGPLWFEHEWASYLELYTRGEQLVPLPRSEREPRVNALSEEVDRSWTLFAKLMMSSPSGGRDAADASLATVHSLRLLAASHLHRLESGAFPADAQPLAARLGGLPQDPFRQGGGPLAYALVDGRVRVWSVGIDGIDGGGKLEGSHGDSRDIVATTAAPPH